MGKNNARKYSFSLFHSRGEHCLFTRLWRPSRSLQESLLWAAGFLYATLFLRLKKTKKTNVATKNEMFSHAAKSVDILFILP